MIVSIRLRLLAGLSVSVALCGSTAAALTRVLPEDILILAQDQPKAAPQTEEEKAKAKERKKAPPEKAPPQKGPPAKAPEEKVIPKAPPPKASSAPPKQLPSIEKEVPKGPVAPTSPPAEKAVPAPPKIIVPPKAPEGKKKLEAPTTPAPAEKIAPPVLPKVLPQSTLPKSQTGPAEQITPQGTPLAPAPQGGIAPTPSPGKMLATPPNGAPTPQPAAPGARLPAVAPAHAVLPAAPAPKSAQPGVPTSPTFAPGFQPPGPPAQHLQDIQKNRTEHTEAGGKRTVIEEPDNRVIVKQDNRVIIRHDESVRLASKATDVHSERRSDGTTETVIVRPGGIQIYNVVDDGGRLVRRYRRDEGGHEINIIDNRRFYRDLGTGLAIAVGVGLAAEVIALNLPPPEVDIPPEKYIVDYDRASDEDLDEALGAPPIEHLERGYSLEEIRFNHELRDRMRRIDLDAINFEFGAWDVAPDQYPILQRIAAAINRIIDRNPDEVFMIEGYTDAVGSDIDNLSLSDHRAQSVAENSYR